MAENTDQWTLYKHKSTQHSNQPLTYPNSHDILLIYKLHQAPVMGKSKSWFDLNHDWITFIDLIWVQKIWLSNVQFDLNLCDLIYDVTKSQI